MPDPVYTYLISDLVSNRTLAEVPLTEVRYAKKLNDSAQLSATLRLGDPRIQTIDPYDLTTPARRAIYALRDGTPVWGGLVWTRRYDSNTEQVSLGCGDFWSYFDHRKVLPVLDEQAYTDPQHVATLDLGWLGADQNTIARELVAVAQAHPGGNIGVVPADSNASGIIRDLTYPGHQIVDTGEALRTLSRLLDGPDIVFDVGPLDRGGRPTRLLRVGTPRLGQQGAPHVFEHGGNLRGYVWPSDGTRMSTRMFATGSAALIAVAEDRGRYQDGWPLLEEERGYSSVSDPAQLAAQAKADQVASRLPVVLPTLGIHSGLPPTLPELTVGDNARVIIKDVFLADGVDTVMRIVGIEVAVGDEGREEVTLTMNPILEDVA
jgi:hypothetical protein